MAVNEERNADLVKKIRDVLISGKKLAVIGWRDSNHDKKTRRMKDLGRVIFYLDAPGNLGSSVGFVIPTPFVSHATVKRLINLADTHSKVFTAGKIREILKSCEDLLLSPRRSAEVEKPFVLPAPQLVVTSSPKIVITTTDALKSVPTEDVERTPALGTSTISEEPETTKTVSVMLTAPKETKEMEPIDKFVVAFMEKKGESAEGLVGKVNLGKLSRDAGLTLTNSQLVTLHWVEPVVSEGRAKAGTYRATAKMRERFEALLKPDEEPTDPIRRAQWLIAQRPKLLLEIVQRAEKFKILKQEFEKTDLELREKVRRIDNLVELMEKLEDQLK